MTTIVFLGDSTLDNRNWTIESACVSEHLNNLFEALNTPVHIFNYAVDCFQTSDVLNKVCNRGPSSMLVVYDHPHFKRAKPVDVLTELSKVPDVTHIVLSVGGNDIRNKIRSFKSLQDLEDCVAELQQNYFEIIERIRSIKPEAQLILMNQYTIDSTKDVHQIYLGFKRLAPSQQPVEFLHRLMIKIYAPIVAKAAEYNLPFIDMASSLDHKDSSNFIMQIEPSTKASLVIAKLIKYVVDHHTNESCSNIYLYEKARVVDYVNPGVWSPIPYNTYSNATTNKEAYSNSAALFPFLLNAGASIALIAGLSAFTVVAVAIAGLIALSATGIGLIAGAGVAATAIATYGFFKANSGEPDKELTLEPVVALGSC